jgi:hypothetical protein
MKLPITAILALALVEISSGCAQTETNSGPRGSRANSGSSSSTHIIPARPADSEHLIGRAHIRALGVVPYDMSALPLVSPDGRFVATQFGAPPTIATRDAAPGATVPGGTRVAIYRLEAREDFNQELPLVSVLEEPLLLGRSCNDEGFLVESPREDGSRWIGFVGWESRELEWIVADDNVNAFAALGPNERIAWSRRPIERGPFELVVQIMGGQFTIGGEVPDAIEETATSPDHQISTSPPGADWLAPTWSETGDGLFVAALREGVLSLAYMQGIDRVGMLQSKQEIRLAFDARVGHAIDMMSGQPAVVGDPQPESPMLLFAHPSARYRGVALWRPLRRGGGSTQILDSRAYAAAIDGAGFVMVAVDGGIEGFPLESPESRITFASEDGVPRTTRSDDWPIVILAPLREQPRLRIVAMQAVAVR